MSQSVVLTSSVAAARPGLTSRATNGGAPIPGVPASSSTAMASPTRNAPPGTPRVRSYREFLTPALHRRFARAAGLLACVCYAEVVAMRESPLAFWSWFPLGTSSIATLLLSISSLVIFILRVAHLRLNPRTSASPFTTFQRCATSPQSLQILATYFFSAWWFSEVYIWLGSSDLHWVIPGKSYELDTLNERPMYLRFHFLTLAAVQTLIHLYYDYDCAAVPGSAIKEAITTAHSFPHSTPLQNLIAATPARLRRALETTVMACPTSFLLYALFFRATVWEWTEKFARLAWNLSHFNLMPTYPPFHWSVLLRCLTGGFLLAALWELSNKAFTIFVALPPLKRGSPLTDASRDPNRSLLTGLTSRKPVVQTFAFWELSLISSASPSRRLTIFSDFERSTGSSWSQIVKVSTDAIQQASRRLTTQTPSPAEIASERQSKVVDYLPRIAAPPQETSVVQDAGPRSGGLSKRLSTFSRSLSQSPNASPTASPMGKYLAEARGKLVHETQLSAGGSQSHQTAADGLFNLLRQFLLSRLGEPFRKTYARQLQTHILGTPQSDSLLLIFAVSAIANLALAGIAEDKFGTVYREVPLIITTLTELTTQIDSFAQTAPVDWTDVTFQTSDVSAKHTPPVDELMDVLRSSLGRLVQGYEPYARDIGLTGDQLRAASRAATPSNT